MFLYTGITRLGDGMALYTGGSGDPVFRGWLKKSTPNYFAIDRHLWANRRVLVHLLASRLQTTVLIRKGTSGMGQRTGRLWRNICKRFNIWFYQSMYFVDYSLNLTYFPFPGGQTPS